MTQLNSYFAVSLDHHRKFEFKTKKVEGRV